MQKDKNVSILVGRLKKRFLLWSTVVFVGVGILVYALEKGQKEHIAKNYVNSTYNFLTIGDFRNAIAILKGSVTADFEKVAYFNSKNVKEFEVVRDDLKDPTIVPKSLYFGTVVHFMSRTPKGDTGRRIELKYNQMNSLLVVLLVWIFLNVFFQFIMVSFEGNVQKYFKNLLEQERLAQIGETTRQIAHDIRSPLSALQVATQDLSGLDEDRKNLVKAATERIKKMADDLLKKESAPAPKKSSNSNKKAAETASKDIVDLSSVVEQACAEKSMTFQGESVKLSCETPLSPTYVSLNSMTFLRVLSNLLNNAYEGVVEKGEGIVNVQLKSSAETAMLTVVDDGVGIPEAILTSLGKEQVTSKENHSDSGSGVGVLHAYREIKKWGGTIQHQNRDGGGTQVMILFPVVKKELQKTL